MSSKQTKRTSKLHFCPLELEESPHAALKGDFVRYRKEARFVALTLTFKTFVALIALFYLSCLSN